MAGVILCMPFSLTTFETWGSNFFLVYLFPYEVRPPDKGTQTFQP